MLNRLHDALLHLWRAATNIKTFVDWLVFAGAVGVLGVSAAIPLLYGRTFDVVLLYLLAGIAFWYVVKEQLRTELNARFAPVHMIWDPECVGCDNSPVQFTRDLYLGLRNSRATTVKNVVITVASLKPKLGFALHFVPQPLTGIGDLRPSGGSHVQHVKFVHDAPTHPEGPAMVLYVSTTGPLRIPHAEYTGTLVVQADDVWPRNYQFEIARHEGVMSLTLQETR